MCPICGKRYKDILRHFVIVHDVKDMDELSQISDEAKIKEDTKKAFANYSEELKKKKEKSEI